MKACSTFGLNRVDMHAPDYGGWDGALSGCCGDASAIATLAAMHGYNTNGFMADYFGEMTAYGSAQPQYRLVGDATREQFRRTMENIANSQTGDTWLLWYSGHGAQVRYTLGREESLCFFDGMLSDNELWSLFRAIPEGVRVFLGLDCCHAGGMPGTREKLVGPYNRIKSCPIRFNSRSPYRPLDKGGIKASLAVWAGCGQGQLSLDGKENGLFTATALSNLDRGMTWKQWAEATRQRMPSNQQPELQLYGPDTWDVPAMQ